MRFLKSISSSPLFKSIPSFSSSSNQLSFFRSSSSNLKSSSLSSMGVVAVSGGDEQGSIARRFWIKFKKETVFSLYTPFVVSLASGNLELDTFRHYIAQDVHFLKAFAQAYELAEDCADDDDDKLSIRDMRKSVIDELKMHASFAQEWGFDPAKDTSANSATVKYTEFLLATASGKVEEGKGVGKIATPFEKTKVAAYALGAMTPCMRLYAFLGKELMGLLDPAEDSHLYKKWIVNYASESFEASALQTEDLLDKLSVSLTGEELEVIEKLYHRAMKLEINFFSAQPITQRIVVPLSRAEIAILTAPKTDQNDPEKSLVRMSSADLRNTWGLLSTQYTEEYEQCIESILPSEKAGEFNSEGLCKALEQLSDFEKRANSRVVESGVLKDVGIVVGSSESLRRLGSQFGVSLVPLFSGLVKKQKEFGGSESSNWKGLSGTLYTVSSWAEIHAFVLGPP
ncbi:hypothetical protein IFM89_025853 [Coptis chinensis]|uniref:Thiaminase-2/PQQC domain-containing protein n=1 Tax=Coptis chinensis TaxID=261450 RepID=A0A835M1Q7_9MAGN|nr:hypothetical protein IFM89_025853 [Coptis chinensis]